METDILSYKVGIRIITIKIPIDYIKTDLKIITTLQINIIWKLT